MEDEEAPAPVQQSWVIPDNVQNTADIEVFSKAAAVSLSEVSIHLKNQVDKAPAGTSHHPGLLEVLDYCQKFAPTKESEVEKALRHVVFSKIQGQSQYLAALVLNLAPETVDEVVQLIPQLAPGNPKSPFANEDEIQKMLDEIAEYRSV
eukprot:TRINITY_DN10272_c0_g4_i1.p3 TRINITY_DN10272_c0_g4~~TRINITY_DN10272_c0_g4_i1.p3  ORF type:complete len:149 (-),score=18.20 TRINITY_DN10272_c0_g4_i1:701-1147(-)